MIYNMAAEFAAFLILFVSIIGLFLDQTLITTRHRIFRWLYSSAFFTSICTILAVYSQGYLDVFAIELVVIFRYLFYIAMPTAAIAVLYYAISLVYTKTNSSHLIKQHTWGIVPYLGYCVIVISNPFTNVIFSYNEEMGIIPEPLYRITYAIVIIYFAITIWFIFKNRHSPRRNSLLIIILNLVVTALVFCIQLFIPTLQMSGLASAVGIMVIHLYIQNIAKSTDELTELFNRQALTIRLNRLCQSKRNFSLYVISLRNFRGINERLGLEIGDALLETVSFRLRKSLPKKALYRYTGDEFALLIEDTSTLDPDLKESLAKQYEINRDSFKLDMIAARVDFPAFGLDAKTIISSMDYSVSMLKQSQGSRSYFYDIKVCDDMKRRYDIIERLNHAIESNGFTPHYQAIFDVSENKFTTAEALVRLNTEDGEFISPAEFIPIAEETGQVLKITNIMLEMVCADFRKLLDKHGDKLPLKSISVNFPYAKFLSRNTVNELTDVLSRYNLTSEQIKIELTERTLSSDIETTKAIVSELVEQGFEFELDDFGVEYSSLSMFFDMPIGIVKFDRSLVLNFTADSSRREFFKTFLEAVKSTDMKVIMEGVEDKELFKFLVNCGSDYIQGYVCARPMPFVDFGNLLLNSNDTTQCTS